LARAISGCYPISETRSRRSVGTDGVPDAGGIALATRTGRQAARGASRGRTLDGTARIRKPPPRGQGTSHWRRRGQRAATGDHCRLTRSRPGLRV